MNPILESTKFVVDNSRFVRLNHDRMADFAANFATKENKHWLETTPVDISRLSDQEKLHLIFLYAAFAFSFWGEPKWTIEYKGKQYDGTYAMFLSLWRALEEGKALLDPAYCATVSKEEFAHIFRGNVEMPLLYERWEIMREIGSTVLAKYQGKAENVVFQADHSVVTLLNLIVHDFPSFYDSSQYLGREIFFYKRAQFLISEIYEVFRHRGLGEFSDVEQLTACADYKLPQILRKLEIFEYEPELANKIDQKIAIPHGSPEEVEIRANTIWAIELIRQEIVKKYPMALAYDINNYLWLATQQKNNTDKPYHRTRTTAY